MKPVFSGDDTLTRSLPGCGLFWQGRGRSPQGAGFGPQARRCFASPQRAPPAETALRAVSADFVRSGDSAAGGCAPPVPPVLLHPQALSRRKSVKIALRHPLQGAKRPPRCPVLSAPGSRPSGRGAAPPSGAPPAGRPCISRRVISWRGRLCSATAPGCRPVSR